MMHKEEIGGQRPLGCIGIVRGTLALLLVAGIRFPTRTERTLPCEQAIFVETTGDSCYVTGSSTVQDGIRVVDVGA